MTKVFDILYNRLYHYYPEYASIDDTKGKFSDEIEFIETADSFNEGDAVIEDNGQRTPLKSYVDTGRLEYRPASAEDYRSLERSTLKGIVQPDLMDAMENLIDGDQSKDWAEIVRTLRQFIADVDATKDQQGYPWEVVYPDIPDMDGQ